MADIGEVVTAQGVTVDLDDTDLVAGCVLVAKIVQADGTVTIAIGNSEGMDWLTQLGLVTAAHQIVSDRQYMTGDDE